MNAKVKAQEFAKKHGFRSVYHVGEWEGFQVFTIGRPGEELDVGFIVFILVNSKGVRWNTKEEFPALNNI